MTDDELKIVRRRYGYILNIDHPTKRIRLHTTKCEFTFAKNPIHMQPSSKTKNVTGKFFFSRDKEELSRKARVYEPLGYNYALCVKCLTG